MKKNKEEHFEALKCRAKWLGILLDCCAGYSEEVSSEDFQWAISRAKRFLSNTVTQIMRYEKNKPV